MSSSLADAPPTLLSTIELRKLHPRRLPQTAAGSDTATTICPPQILLVFIGNGASVSWTEGRGGGTGHSLGSVSSDRTAGTCLTHFYCLLPPFVAALYSNYARCRGITAQFSPFTAVIRGFTAVYITVSLYTNDSSRRAIGNLTKFTSVNCHHSVVDPGGLPCANGPLRGDKLRLFGNI